MYLNLYLPRFTCVIVHIYIYVFREREREAWGKTEIDNCGYFWEGIMEALGRTKIYFH